MKRRNILAIVAVVCAALSLSSCLKNQVDYFGETASARMEKYLKNAREVLYGAENGWRMEYFTDYGGYNYALKFIDHDALGKQIDSVVATSELSAETVYGSNFRLTNDDGPVLSFDTYNDILHYFATPSSSDYQANGGDFEFIILAANPQEVILKGKRTGRISKLYPLEEDMVHFAKRMNVKSSEFIVISADGINSDGDKIHLDFDLNSHSTLFSSYLEDGKTIDEVNAVLMPFIITEDGIKYYEQFKFKGLKISELYYNKASRLLFNDDDASFKVAKIPDDYTMFHDFVGEYEFTYSDGGMTKTADVTIEVIDELSKLVEMKGFTEDYHGVYMEYNSTTGRLEIYPQYAGVYNDVDMIVFLPIAGGYYSFNGYTDLVPNPTPEQGFKFVGHDADKTKTTQWGMLREFVDDEGDSDYDQFSEWKPSNITFKTLVRK